MCNTQASVAGSPKQKHLRNNFPISHICLLFAAFPNCFRRTKQIETPKTPLPEQILFPQQQAATSSSKYNIPISNTQKDQSPQAKQLYQLAVGQNLRYLFVVGYHPTIVFLKGFLGVHRGTRVLTHCQLTKPYQTRPKPQHPIPNSSPARASIKVPGSFGDHRLRKHPECTAFPSSWRQDRVVEQFVEQFLFALVVCCFFNVFFPCVTLNILVCFWFFLIY